MWKIKISMGKVYRTTEDFAEERTAAEAEIGTGNGATRQSAESYFDCRIALEVKPTRKQEHLGLASLVYPGSYTESGYVRPLYLL